MPNVLRTKVLERIKVAKNKKIYPKAKSVAEQQGTHSNPSYVDSGETFYEDLWVFKKDGLKISFHRGYFGHITVTVEHGSQLVFRALDNPGQKGRKITIDAYVPSPDWESKLNEFYQPIQRKVRKEKRREENNVKKRFGLI